MSERSADSLLSLLIALVQFALIVLGMIGISVQVFREHGWFSQAVTGFMNNVMEIWSLTTLVILSFLLLVVLTIRQWYGMNFAKGAPEKVANLLMFAMMGMGGFFLYRLVTTGSFTGQM